MRAPLLLLPLPALLALGFQAPSGAQGTAPGASFSLEAYAQESYTLVDLLRIGRERNPDLLALRAERDALLG